MLFLFLDIWKVFLRQNPFNLWFFCATPAALAMAVLKAIVPFCRRFAVFKIRFVSETQN